MTRIYAANLHPVTLSKRVARIRRIAGERKARVRFETIVGQAEISGGRGEVCAGGLLGGHGGEGLGGRRNMSHWRNRQGRKRIYMRQSPLPVS